MLDAWLRSWTGHRCPAVGWVSRWVGPAPPLSHHSVAGECGWSSRGGQCCAPNGGTPGSPQSLGWPLWLGWARGLAGPGCVHAGGFLCKDVPPCPLGPTMTVSAAVWCHPGLCWWVAGHLLPQLRRPPAHWWRLGYRKSPRSAPHHAWSTPRTKWIRIKIYFYIYFLVNFSRNCMYYNTFIFTQADINSSAVCGCLCQLAFFVQNS